MHTTTNTPHRTLARETPGTYEASPPSDAPPPEAPLDLPPALAELLGIATDVDRQIARMITLLARLQASGEVEAATQLPVEAWLAQLGRITRIDRRFLALAADVLAPMPATLAAFGDGSLSWSQIRAIVTAVRPLKIAQRAQLDHQIAEAAHQFATWDPEQIVWRVELLAAELTTPHHPDDDVDGLLEAPERPADVLVLQPRLDGGGKLHGHYHDPLAYATIEEALSQAMGRPDSLEASRDHEARTRNAQRISQARAQALTDLCANSLAGHTHHPTTTTSGTTHAASTSDTASHSDGTSGSDSTSHTASDTTTDRDSSSTDGSCGCGGTAVAARPLFFGTIQLETLLGLSHLPGDILTRMTGGRLRVDAATARRLFDQAGAGLRTIVIDQTGQAVGVGTRTYLAPGWLRDTMLALQHECAAPGCRVAARNGDLDHIVAWPGGPTDVDNLQFACRSDHRAKTQGRWQVEVLADGTRRWRHVASGLTTDTPLATRPLTTPACQPPRPELPGRRP